MKNNKNLKVVNMLGGPGCRKSTTALLVAGLMKAKKLNVEYVNEYPKDLVYENRPDMFAEQDYIFAQQNKRLRRLVKSKVEWAITDTSLLLSLFYRPQNFYENDSFDSFVRSVYSTYTNINILLSRPDNYVQFGRNETEEQAKQIDKNIVDFLNKNYIQYFSFESYDPLKTAEKIVKLITSVDWCNSCTHD
jgi:ABC-type Fe3+/spermidine/putrescine transport system ATPase subunit